METTKFNKILASIIMIIGLITTIIAKDLGALVFISFIAIPLFFCKENVTMFREDNNDDTEKAQR